MTFDQTWQWYCIQDVTKTFTHTIQDGPGSNDFLVLSEPLSVDANGSAFGMGIGSQEEFTDVRLGAVLNADGQASSSKQSIYAISGRTQYFNHPGGGGVLPYPGVYASGYALLMSWENAPARLEIELQKYICLSNIMNTGFFTVQIPGADPDKSYYAVLDIVGSGPVYVTGSLYEYKGGPLVARIPTLIDTDLKDWWEDADDTDTFWIVDVKVFPITNFMDKNYRKSGIAALNEDSTPPGYRVTFDDVSSISNGPAAVNPYPADGATGVPIINTVLSWKEAIFATSRDLWFGKAGKMQKISPSPAGKTYDPGTLELGKTYEWRVDEIGPPTVTGYLWSFTTIPCLVVDDFEKYTNSEPNIIYKTWKDGLGYNPQGNGTGSKAGYRDPDYAEVTIVHEGKQSLPVDYNNAKLPYYSEVDRTFDTPQDWTVYGVKALTLWLRGYPSVPAGTFTGSDPYTMTASGTDIGDVPDVRKPSKFHDEFHYACMQVSGDYAIAVKVESITNTDAWAKAGIMIRDSADANSMHVMACLTPSTANGIALQNRAVAGGPSTNIINIPNFNPPCWISLTRTGTNFAAGYRQLDTDDWTHLGDVTVTMADPVCIGLSLTSHNASATCTAVFSNVALYNIVDNVYIPVTPSWTSRDIGIKSNVAAPLYVTLQDSGQKTATVTYKDSNNNVDPNIVLTTTWQAWDITLKDFADINDVNLAAIKKITIGIGNKGASQAGGVGTVYFDDIRLYPTRCIPDRIKGDLNNDCFPDYTDLDILADNWLITPSSSLNFGLEAYYMFEGNLKDSSGKDRHGDPYGAPTYAAGKVGQAVSLDGVDDYIGTQVNASGLGIGDGKPKTVAAWVYTRAFNDGGIFDMGNYADGQNFSLRTMTTTNTWRAQRWGAPTYDFDFVYPSLNTWVHMALVYDGSAAGNESRAYADGALVGDQTVALNTVDTVPFRIGRWQNNYFSGRIDELRVYSRALSLAEIQYLASKTRAADINKDGTVDFRDYAFLADKWLEEVLWP
jgi:hypothetical protein